MTKEARMTKSEAAKCRAVSHDAASFVIRNSSFGIRHSEFVIPSSLGISSFVIPANDSLKNQEAMSNEG